MTLLDELKERNAKQEHKERHELLHLYLDELVADFIGQNNKLMSESTIMELMEWSYQQTLNPTGENK